MAETFESVRQIASLLMPYTAKSMEALQSRNSRLAHYTTAESALSILKTKCLWMRNARVMSDFSEIQYGFERLREYFLSNGKRNRTRLYNALDKCHPDIGTDAIKSFDDWSDYIHTSTYICCMSEHLNSENELGRLSMWRAFGQGVPGVAIVLKMPGNYSADALQIALSPVAYMTAEQLGAEMDTVIGNIESNIELFKSTSRVLLHHLVYRVLTFAVASMKHPGFEEEKEWRLIHSPAMYPSNFVPSTTETVRGIPQIIHKIPLVNAPDAKITGIAPHEILERLIVGPTDHSYAIYEALAKELETLGVKDARQKVYISGIPLRN